MLELKLRRIGTSLGALLPKNELDRKGLREGDTFLVPKLVPKAAQDLYGVWKMNPVKLAFLED
jgi:hypothetical protein